MKTLSRCLLTVFAALGLSGCASDAIRLPQGQVLLIQSPEGKAAIQFTSFGDKDGESTYKWRYRAVTAPRTTETGEGKVFEKYNETTVVPAFHRLHDRGSQLNVTAGPFQVEWSYGSKGSYGWIYPGTNTQLIKVLEGIEFESYQP